MGAVFGGAVCGSCVGLYVGELCGAVGGSCVGEMVWGKGCIRELCGEEVWCMGICGGSYVAGCGPTLWVKLCVRSCVGAAWESCGGSCGGTVA